MSVMNGSYKIVFQGGTGEIVEKKSRFIASVFSVESEEEAIEIIEKTKKKYWDARHNCYAYVIGADGGRQRCSDDGEPQGTAGRPMLDVLLAQDIKNIIVIVTRYFGGTLLGTGGLVRAYSMSTKAGIDASVIVDKCPGNRIKVTTDYNGIGKLQYIAASLDMPVLATDYLDKVIMTVLASGENKDSFVSKVNEATSATAVIEDEGEVWYAQLEDKSIHLF